MVIPSKKNSPVYRLRQHYIYALLFACFLWTSTCVVYWRFLKVRRFQPPSPKHNLQNNNLAAILVPDMGISHDDMGISYDEWTSLQKALDWLSPDEEITQLNLSTSPVHSTFSIVELNESYKVGEKIHVTITARDHNNNLKPYGGDFFQAKLFNLELKAGVFGEVVDHLNGTWEGQAQVSVRLMHSSEAVQLLKKYGSMERCRPGLTTPVPAGFYLHDVWKSFVCCTKHFSRQEMGNCLRNKIVYMLGDSTTRQWFEHFLSTVPG
ncbi:NXPE family member 4-like isoform X4 [Myxocyprinus asiaticus]|uniref:NXPE family member 4-like isoform X4 n=1 Tax=Myxocyprinus asiaticus TaxID=70543 RepID=UPI002223A215|nr:NXPE family member 4-like isoform X4 [Myxocyprinus asiaticus]